MLLVLSERQREKQNGELPRHEAGLKRIWKLPRVTVVPVIIGALGTVSKGIEK